MRDHAYHRQVTCEYCGTRFMDDCGDSFCSSTCERLYENELLREEEGEE